MRAKTVITGSVALTLLFAGCNRDEAPTVQEKSQQHEVRTDVTPTTWRYSEKQDEMGRGTAKLAQVVSLNTVHLGFPYQGETHAGLQLRKRPNYGQDVMLSVELGQFVSSHTRRSITARFDDGELRNFDVGEPAESTPGILFIHDNEDFVNQLRKAKSLKVEVDFFQEGRRVFTFDVQGLNWKESN